MEADLNYLAPVLHEDGGRVGVLFLQSGRISGILHQTEVSVVEDVSDVNKCNIPFLHAISSRGAGPSAP